MTEGTLVELSNGSVIMANMRNKNVYETTDCNGQSHCRAIAMSNDKGNTFNSVYPCPQLIELISTNEAIYFSNPNSTTSRVNMTVKKGAYSNQIGLLFETGAKNCSGPSCQIRFTTIPSDF
eukprot:94875_1